MGVLKKNKTTVAMIVFLLGIFMGAMDTGIVSPARTVIANALNLDSTLSVWMVTIYSLAYAVSMPITSKLSDRFGRKKVYMICVSIFAFGSLLCGLANNIESYNFLLVSRVIQAIGGGGILPIATAYIGASFPEEKRGSALGLVGAIFGIATLIGPTVGTFILSIAGNDHWGYLFFVNLPISIIILSLASLLEENKAELLNKKMDLLGSVLIGIIILSLMYALTNLQFHNFIESFTSLQVWPYLLVFVIFLPLFIYVEKKANDPVLNLKFFTSKQTALTLLISFIVGCGLMGTVFLPQFAENVLKIKIGTGGYIVTLFAVVTGIAAPLGGNLIDRIGVKRILILGFSSTVIGTLYQALVTASHPTFTHLFIGLVFMGIGMGLTMGTPVNYLMMSLVEPHEISMGQATVSLIRSIGVAISPNILVNFIAEAGTKVPTDIQNVLPQLNGLPANSFNLSDQQLDPTLLAKFQAADVTTIFETVKEFVNGIFTGLKPTLSNVPGVDFETVKTSYFAALEQSQSLIEQTYQTTLNTGFSHLFIGAAIIAGVGLVVSLFIKSKQQNNINMRH